MEILPEREVDETGFYWSLNKITINDFWEINLMSEDYWTREDYKRQWKEGFARLKQYDTSCLVASIQHPQKNVPLLNWWILYKIDNEIMIQNQLLYNEIYKEEVGNKLFLPETCYNFITPRVTHTTSGHKISEWIVEL